MYNSVSDAMELREEKRFRFPLLRISIFNHLLATCQFSGIAKKRMSKLSQSSCGGKE